MPKKRLSHKKISDDRKSSSEEEENTEEVYKRPSRKLPGRHLSKEGKTYSSDPLGIYAINLHKRGSSGLSGNPHGGMKTPIYGSADAVFGIGSKPAGMKRIASIRNMILNAGGLASSILSKSLPTSEQNLMVPFSYKALENFINDDDLVGLKIFLSSRTVAIDDRDDTNSTALILCSRLGKNDFCRELLEHGADVNAEDNDQWTSLLTASREGHHDVLATLLEHGSHIEHKDLGGWTALNWACYKGHVDAARVLLTSGADPNAVGYHHMSSLVWAAGRGYTEIVHELLKKNAKVNLSDKFGTTPLIWACRKGYYDIAEMLLQNGANVDATGLYSWTPILVAVKGNYMDLVQLLLDYKSSVHATDKDGGTALTISCKEGYADIAQMLLKAGAHVNIKDRNGDTNLIFSSRGGHRAVVEALLQKHADINMVGKDKKSALYWAVEKDHVQNVKLLISSGADLEHATKEGDTPLLKAVRNKNSEIVQIMVDQKARVSVADKKGDTVLHIAMRGRSKRIVEILLRNPKHSQLLYRPNQAGETPYNIDLANQKTILGQIFGARRLNTNEENENMLGYDLYSSSLADILSEPSLSMPISVGLYARWGSGKSFLIRKLKEEMLGFARQWVEPRFQFTALVFLLLFMVSVIAGFIVLLSTSSWYIGCAAGSGLFTMCLMMMVSISYGSKSKYDWHLWYQWSIGLESQMASFKLVLQVIFCSPPGEQWKEWKDGVQARPLKFIFAEGAKPTASGVGGNSVVHILGSLFDMVENQYGIFSTRFYRSFRPKAQGTTSPWKYRRLCGIPYIAIFFVTLSCSMALTYLAVTYGFHEVSPAAIVEKDLRNRKMEDDLKRFNHLEQDSSHLRLNHDRNYPYVSEGALSKKKRGSGSLLSDDTIKSRGGGPYLGDGEPRNTRVSHDSDVDSVRTSRHVDAQSTVNVKLKDFGDFLSDSGVISDGDSLRDSSIKTNSDRIRRYLDLSDSILSNGRSNDYDGIVPHGWNVVGNDREVLNRRGEDVGEPANIVEDYERELYPGYENERGRNWHNPDGEQARFIEDYYMLENGDNGRSREHVGKEEIKSRVRRTLVDDDDDDDDDDLDDDDNDEYDDENGNEDGEENPQGGSAKGGQDEYGRPLHGRLINPLLFFLSGLVALVFIANIHTLARMTKALIFSHKTHLYRTCKKYDSTNTEGCMQTLKSETELMVDMIKCLDSFTVQQTRLVVVLDGLDTCEQEKVLVVLDAVHSLFTDSNGPFIIILAIDPHIIARAIELNATKVFRESSISGHDYLRNIIHLPFYLQNAGLRKVKQAEKAAEHMRGKIHPSRTADQETDLVSLAATSVMGGLHHVASNRRLSSDSGFGGRRMTGKSKRIRADSIGSSIASNLHRVSAASDLNKVLLTDDYFSDINPRSMRRLMNVVYITGRLLKSFHIEFNWYHLALWVNMTEQWPYRSSYLITFYESKEKLFQDKSTLREVYDKMKHLVPTSKEVEPLLEMDRDERKFESFLVKHEDVLHVFNLIIFLPFTINLDPFIKKRIKEEMIQVNDMMPVDSPNGMPPWGRVQKDKSRASTLNWNAKLGSLSSKYQPPMHPQQQMNPYNMWGYPPPPPPSFMGSGPVLTNYGSYPQLSQRGMEAMHLPTEAKNQVLSTMTIEDIFELFSKVEGVTTATLPNYKEKLVTNNINGKVLLHCNLEDLKSILLMNFGDWELFKMLILGLRDNEISKEDFYTRNILGQEELRPRDSIGQSSVGHVSIHPSDSLSDQSESSAGLDGFRRGSSFRSGTSYSSSKDREDSRRSTKHNLHNKQDDSTPSDVDVEPEHFLWRESSRTEMPSLLEHAEGTIEI